MMYPVAHDFGAQNNLQNPQPLVRAQALYFPPAQEYLSENDKLRQTNYELRCEHVKLLREMGNLSHTIADLKRQIEEEVVKHQTEELKEKVLDLKRQLKYAETAHSIKDTANQEIIAKLNRQNAILESEKIVLQQEKNKQDKKINELGKETVFLSSNLEKSQTESERLAKEADDLLLKLIDKTAAEVIKKIDDEFTNIGKSILLETVMVGTLVLAWTIPIVGIPVLIGEGGLIGKYEDHERYSRWAAGRMKDYLLAHKQEFKNDPAGTVSKGFKILYQEVQK
jgi:hypothetical protein